VGKTEMAALYCRRYPNMPSRGIARLIIREHPEAFENVEHARSSVRSVRGQKGEARRLRNGKKYADIIERYEHGLPAAEPFDVTPRSIDTSPLLVLADIHVPFHEPEIISLAIKEGKKRGCKGVLLNGDTADCYRFSRFMKQPGIAFFEKEKQGVIELLDLLNDKFKKIYWKSGNHDDRLPNYIYQNAPELFTPECSNLSWESFLDVADFGIKWIDSWRRIYYGKLAIMHGHEFGGAGIGSVSSVNPARGLFLQSKAVALAAHSHQTATHNEPDLRGRLITCWSMGCCCQLAARYRPITKWNHGFVIVEKTDSDGNFNLTNYRVLPGGGLVT
jgi:predicted phosphodiesterase